MHEAGHAIMAVHFRFPLGAISIEPDGLFAGITRTPEAGELGTQHPDVLFALEKDIIILMAGTEAVKVAFPKMVRPWAGDGNDRQQIDIRVKNLCLFTTEGARTAKRRLRQVTGWYMSDHAIRSAVVDLANELLSKTTLGKGSANKFIKETLETHHRNFYPERFIKKNGGRQ